MNEAYQKLSESIDNWLSDRSKDIKMARIEKEILLEKLRNLYVFISDMETEEYAAPQEVEVPKPTEEQKPQRKFTPAKTLEEDVDLFLDPEHESYKQVEEELQKLANEIEESQDHPAPVAEVKPSTPVQSPDKHADIFDRLEEKPEVEEDKEIHDDAEELFDEPDIEINVTAEEESHAEDDILQFIPPKTAPAKPQPEPAPAPKPAPAPTPAPVSEKKPEPAPEPVPAPAPKPEVKQTPIAQKPPQRSLNDLFNERREDHSISSQYQRAKVGDLTKAISINDKFIYIKELFHNRGEDFSASIKQLNECKNMEEAFDCLEQLKQKFFWDSKSDAYLSFCDLLRRKYS